MYQVTPIVQSASVCRLIEPFPNIYRIKYHFYHYAYYLFYQQYKIDFDSFNFSQFWTQNNDF